MEPYSPIMTVMLKAVRKASRKLVRDFGEVENLQVSKKAPKDFVSEADLRAEKILIEELSHARPKYSVLAEESGEIPGEDKEYRWIIDPLDGTTNFLHGFSFFCTTIALEKTLANGKKEIVAAVTHAPILKETFMAEKNQGAWLETAERVGLTRLRVASRMRLSNSLLCIGSYTTDIENIGNIPSKVSATRCMGSTALALAYIAAGRYDCFIQEKSYPWDLAAGILLTREAGGYVSDFSDKGKIFENKNIIATNEELYRLIYKKINEK